MPVKCLLSMMDGCGGIRGQKRGQSTPVVVVAVRQHAPVHRRKIDAKASGVAGKRRILARVQQNAGVSGFDVERKAVPGLQVLAFGPILIECDNLHAHLACDARSTAGWHVIMSSRSREQGAPVPVESLFRIIPQAMPNAQVVAHLQAMVNAPDTFAQTNLGCGKPFPRAVPERILKERSDA